MGHQAFLATIEPKYRIPDIIFMSMLPNPFESLHIDHIDPLPAGQHPHPGNDRCLLDAGQIIPHQDCIFQHFGRFRTPDVIYTDQGPAFRVITVVEGRTFLRHSIIEGGERSRRARLSRSHAPSTCHAF